MIIVDNLIARVGLLEERIRALEKDKKQLENLFEATMDYIKKSNSRN